MQEQLTVLQGGSNAPSAYTDTYAFDLNSNRITKTHDAGNDGTVDETISSTYNTADQLITTESTTSGTSTYTYDKNGSLIQIVSSSGTVRYVYDLRNRMVGYNANGNIDGNWQDILTDAGDVAYTYSFTGVRTSQTIVGGNTTTYQQDENNATGYSQILHEITTDGTNVYTRSYIIGMELLGQSDGTTELYYLTDGHGSVRAVLTVNTEGNVIVAESYAYDAYGNAAGTFTFSMDTQTGAYTVSAIISTQALTQIRYTGQYLDTVLNQYNLRNRIYDPATGRFISYDSYLGDTSSPLSLHKYLYANGNPVMNWDPSGHFSIIESITVASTYAYNMAYIAMANPAPLIFFATRIAITAYFASSIQLALEQTGIVAPTGYTEDLVSFFSLTSFSLAEQVLRYSSVVSSTRRMEPKQSPVANAQQAETSIIVFRGDKRSPEQIIASGGFTSWSTNSSVEYHTSGGGTGGYVSTTTNLEVAKGAVGNGGWVYAIRIPARSLWYVYDPILSEFSIPGFNQKGQIAIPVEDIICARQVNADFSLSTQQFNNPEFGH